MEESWNKHRQKVFYIKIVFIKYAVFIYLSIWYWNLIYKKKMFDIVKRESEVMFCVDCLPGWWLRCVSWDVGGRPWLLEVGGVTLCSCRPLSPASVQHEQTTVSPGVDCPHCPRCPQCGRQVRGWSLTMSNVVNDVDWFQWAVRGGCWLQVQVRPVLCRCVPGGAMEENLLFLPGSPGAASKHQQSDRDRATPAGHHHRLALSRLPGRGGVRGPSVLPVGEAQQLRDVPDDHRQASATSTDWPSHGSHLLRHCHRTHLSLSSANTLDYNIID